MEDDTKVVNLFEEDNTVLSLLTSVIDHDMDELVILGLKDGEIYYGTSNYDSKLKMLGALEVIKAYIMGQED